MKSFWQRWRTRRWQAAPRAPVWGEGSPEILGVCQRCGAVVLRGWHVEAPPGYLCLRCHHAGDPFREARP